MNQIPILDKGFVRLEAHCASDLSVVNAARVSFNNRHEKMEEGDDKLISYLMREHHGTPFEHNFFCFHVKAPIMVFREWHRHRIGVSINEQSGRYTELAREFYVPDFVRKQVGKQGHYEFVPADEETKAMVRAAIEEECNAAFDRYDALLAAGIAKEQARVVLPVNTYSQMYWSCNARSLMAFLQLRTAPNAMYEIRLYANVLESIFSEIMPITAKSFIENSRIHP